MAPTQFDSLPSYVQMAMLCKYEEKHKTRLLITFNYKIITVGLKQKAFHL